MKIALKRIFSIILAVLMCTSAFPVSIFAEETEEQSEALEAEFQSDTEILEFVDTEELHEEETPEESEEPEIEEIPEETEGPETEEVPEEAEEQEVEEIPEETEEPEIEEIPEESEEPEIEEVPEETGEPEEDLTDICESSMEMVEVISNAMSDAALNNADEYKITYENVFDAENNNPTAYTKGKSVALTSISREGYVFGGWYKESAYKTKVTSISSTSSGDITLYAKWTPINYTVVFNANGGSGSMKQLSCSYDTGYALSENKFTRKGYVFNGWNTAKDGTGDPFEDEEWFENLSSVKGAKITLYAQWDPINYIVRFDANGGEGIIEDQEFRYDEQKPLFSNEFTRRGYMFNGWKKGSTSYKENQSVKNLSAVEGEVVVLTAQWKADPAYEGYNYSIVFEGNGSTKGTMKPLAMKLGTEKALTSNTYTKDGYHFAGWSREQDGETVYQNKAKVIDLNEVYGENPVVLYAVWEANTYTVTFNGNKGNYIPEGATKAATTYTQIFTYDELETLDPVKFSQNGYEFKEWNTKNNGTGVSYSDSCSEVFNLSTANNGKATLYAIWDPITYNIVYDLGGGTNSELNPEEYNTTKAVSLKVPTKKGSTFVGWYDETGKKVTSIAKGSFGDKMLTAYWNVNTYSVKLNANGGKGTAQTFKGLKYEVESFTVPESPFYFTGYDFTGWNTAADSSGESYEVGEIVDFDVKNNGTVNLYAQWTYTFDIDGNGDNDNTFITDIKRNYKESFIIDFEPERDGYTFVGWNTDKAKADLGTAQFKPGAKISNIAGKNLYAAWKPISYKVMFDPNGATGKASTQTFTYGKTAALKANTFKRPGYAFIGWNTDPYGYGTYYFNGEYCGNMTAVPETIVLYAQWQRETYTISYVLNGGDDRYTNNPYYYDVDSPTIYLGSPVREGYTFAGWYKDPRFSSKITQIKQGSTGDLTLYAKWTALKYKIMFFANGGSGSMSSMQCTYGSVYNLPASKFTRSWWLFDGWNTEPDGSGEYFYDREAVWNLGNFEGEIICLYAQWKPYVDIVFDDWDREFSEYGTQKYSSFIITEYEWSWTKNYRGTYDVDIDLVCERTYDMGNWEFCHATYKLISADSERVVESGNLLEGYIDVGDVFTMSESWYGLPIGTYYLVVSDYVW